MLIPVDDIKSERYESPVYNALKDWAKEQQNLWETMKTHVKELYHRVPERDD